MATHLDEDAVAAVRNVKTAITKSQQQLADAELSVAKVELELQTALTWTAGVGFTVMIVDIGATYEHANTQTLTLDLTPAEPELESLGPPDLADTLSQAIVATVAATKEAADTQPHFQLEEAAVALQVGISKDGKIEVFVKGGGEKATTHTLTLTLKPK
jgi:hypothetical protein